MVIARRPVFVYDCPDPHALAEFYAALLGRQIDPDQRGDWVEIVADDGNRIAFQQVADYQRPQWPGQEHPQQLHLDVEVDDLDDGEAAVTERGAVKHPVQPSQSDSFRVFLDPAGHPFCLCKASAGGTVGA